MDVRAANDRIAEKAGRLRFVSRVPMLCECGEPGCRTIVPINLEEFAWIRTEPDRFLAAPAHGLEGAALHEETPDYTVWRQRRR